MPVYIADYESSCEQKTKSQKNVQSANGDEGVLEKNFEHKK